MSHSLRPRLPWVKSYANEGKCEQWRQQRFAYRMLCTNLLKVFLVSLKFRKARVASQSRATWKFFRCRIQAAISLYAQASKTTAVTISLFPSYAPSPSGHAPNPPPSWRAHFYQVSKYERKSWTLSSVHSAVFYYSNHNEGAISAPVTMHCNTRHYE